MVRVSRFMLGFGLMAGLFGFVPAQAAILYVDKDNGCPGTGTSQAPYCRIQNAFNAASAGDTIRIRDSATPYDESATATRSGTSGNPIIVEPDAGNNPTLRYTGNGAMAAVIQILGQDYWTVRNLTFDGTGVFTSQMAVWVASGSTREQVGVQILNNTFKNWGGSEAQEDTSPNKPSALIISSGWDPPAGWPAPNGTVIRGNIFDGNRRKSIQLLSTRNTIVENNEIKNATCGRDSDGAVNEIGIHVGTGSNHEHTGDTIRNNTIHDFAPWSACSLTSAPGTWSTMPGIWADVGPTGGTVDGNRIWNLDQGNTGGVVLSVGVFIEYDCHDWTVKNNVIYNIGRAGFRHSPVTAGAVNRWFNNTVYNTGVHGMQLWYGNAVVKNNIFDNAGSSQIMATANAVSQGNLTINYNDYWDNAGGGKVGQWNGSTQKLADWKSTCNCDANSLNTDPLFAAPPLNFALPPSSPLRGSGEGGVDMGVYALSPPTNLRILQVLP